MPKSKTQIDFNDETSNPKEHTHKFVRIEAQEHYF
jgi:hypothetical protein